MKSFIINFIIIISSTALAVNETLSSRFLQSDSLQIHGIKMTVKFVGPTAFDVKWKLLSNAYVTTHFLLTYSTQFSDEVKFTDKNNITLTALNECTSYLITVRCIYGDGKNITFGSFSSEIALTSHSSQLKMVEMLTVKTSSRTGLIEWRSPIEHKLCVVKYHISLNSSSDIPGKEIQTEANHYMITALEPCGKYYGYVSAIDKDGVKGNPVPFNFTTNYAISGPVIKLSAMSNNSNSIFVSWDRPINSSLCIHKYSVVYCHETFVCYKLFTQVNFITITHLKPYVTYQITITPTIGNIDSGPSAKTECTVIAEVSDPPKDLSIVRVTDNSVVLSWSAPNTVLSGAIVNYNWRVTFKYVLYEVLSHCMPQAEHTVTYTINNYKSNQYEVMNLKPFSCYFIELSGSTKSAGFGNSTNITIHTFPSNSLPVEDLKVKSIESNLVVLNWKYPCNPNGKIAFFHSTLVGERTGFHNHIFSIKLDISENETEFEYSLTNLLPEYRYLCTVVAITYNVETPGQDKRISFVTPSKIPDIPMKYDTYRRLRVTVSENHLTQVRLFIPGDLFSNSNGNIKYYSIIVYQDGGFPDKPERGNLRNLRDGSMPKTRTWAEAAPYPFILAYQTTPDKWMPFRDENDVIFDIGADENCPKYDEKIYCNGPLRPVTNYRLKLRAFTADGYQDSWTVPFTTHGEPTAVYYLVLYSVLFAVLITAIGMFCILNERVPWAAKYKKIHTTTEEFSFPGEMNFKQLLAKTPQEIEAEYNRLNLLYVKSNISIDVAAMPLNKHKNRYINTLPYDYNRVIIKSSADNDYINASFIEDSKGVQQYIACQGPMRNTCTDMWQMILDQDVASIVMLCQTTENNKIKCEQYFPNSNEKLVFGRIQVKNDIVNIDKDKTFTSRILTILKGDLKKTIRHFHFHDWPDFGTPKNVEILIQFCRIVQAKSPKGLIVVHCSAGVGRTGTYIACDILMRQMQNSTKLNIFKTVLKLREQRTNMVQTQAQYEFVYKFVLCYLNQNNMKINSFDKEDNSLANTTSTSSTIIPAVQPCSGLRY